MSLGWQKTLLHELSHSWFGNSVTISHGTMSGLMRVLQHMQPLYYEYAVNEAAICKNYKLDARFNATRNLILEDDTDYGNIFTAFIFTKAHGFYICSEDN